MIAYEELVAALDRYVARNGGTPQSARAPAGGAMPAFAPPPAVEAHHDEPAHDVDLPSFDEHHDPDLPAVGVGPHGGDEDATHVGASPGAGNLPPPLQPVHHEDQSNEIDIGDVLTDDEM
jgi:hypothetical protein